MGANAVLVQKRLGHKKISTTLGTYAHLYPDYTESVTAQLEAPGESIGEGIKKEENRNRPAKARNRPAKARPQKDKRHPTQNRVPHFVMQSFPE